MLEDEEEGEGLDEEAEVALAFLDTAGGRVWEEVLVLVGFRLRPRGYLGCFCGLVGARGFPNSETPFIVDICSGVCVC